MNLAYQMLLYSTAAGLSAFCISLYVLSIYADYATARRTHVAPARGLKAASLGFRMIRPFARFLGHLISSALARLEQRYGEGGLTGYLMRVRLRLQRTLVGAGSPGSLTADEMLGAICFSVLCWTGIALVLWALLGTSFAVLVGLAVGFAHPFLWLRRTVARRRSEIRKLLPYALDLLTLSVEAGLDFTAALARMAPKLGETALAEEFGEMLRQIRLGKARSEALRDMADRVGMGEMTSFTSSLIQADELGADLGPVLRMLSDQMRTERANRAEKKAMEAPVKILFPLIAFIFPTVFIILFAPIGINYLRHLFGY